MKIDLNDEFEEPFVRPIYAEPTSGENTIQIVCESLDPTRRNASVTINVADQAYELSLDAAYEAILERVGLAMGIRANDKPLDRSEPAALFTLFEFIEFHKSYVIPRNNLFTKLKQAL